MRLAWSLLDGLGQPLLGHGRVFARLLTIEGRSALVSVNEHGHEQWRVYGKFEGLTLHGNVLLGTVEERRQKSLITLDALTGLELRRTPAPLDMAFLIPGGQDYIGVGVSRDSSGVLTVTLGRVSVETQAIEWQVESKGVAQDRAFGAAFDLQPVADEDLLFVGRGSAFVAHDLRNGAEAWRTGLPNPGLFGWRAMASRGRLVISTKTGTTLLDSRTGLCIAEMPTPGTHAVYGDTVPSVDTSKPATTWTGKTGHHGSGGRDWLVLTA